MANRRRGAFSLPEELRTNERLSTKKELAQRKCLPPCPPVPNKMRKSLLSSNGTFDKPKPVCFNKSVELSPVYNPSLESSYFEQLFRRHSLIGEGSFGKVYRARNREDNKLYAVKRLKSVISFKDRYAEVRNNEKVGVHPNCVQFFMAWEESSELYMLLEFCDMSLSDFSMLNSDIPEDLLWDVLYDICKALDYLHNKDLLHLDVKPGNIMMKNGYHKLTDFGILVDLKLAPMVCKSTLSDGDSKYLALEVLEGIYKPACDIFGLGISLLELAADLELPSHGPLWQQLRHEILPQAFYDRVSLGFKVIIERMLKPKYDARPTAEKILKYSTLKAIEKRDKKQARYDYASEFMNIEDESGDYDDISLHSIPIIINNNNIMHTPPCGPLYNQVDTPELTEYRRQEFEEAPNQLGCKNLLLVSEQDPSPNNCNHNVTLSEMNELIEASLNSHPSSPDLGKSYSNDSSMLAADLADTRHSTHLFDMDVDEDNENERSTGNLILNDKSLITSTPILRTKQHRRILKTKLSFE